MTSVQVQDLEQTLWFNYYRQIVNQLVGGGGTLGPDAVVYVAPITSQGIAGGDWIPTEVTNNQLFRVADSLLPPDSPVYLPGSTAGGYVRALQKYLNWVQLNGNPSQANKIRLTNALNALNASIEAFSREEDAAYEAFDKWKRRNPTSTINFITWTQTNRPSYFTKWQDQQGAAANVAQLNLEINGNDAVVWGQQIQALSNSLGPIATDGLTMDTVTADLTNIQANLDAARQGKPPNTAVRGVIQRPNYSMQGYKDQVNEWVNNFSNQKPTTISFSSASAGSSSWSNYNFQNINANGGFSTSWFFFSARASIDDTTVSNTLQFNSQTASVQVKITFTALKTFEVAPGLWDVPNVRKMYPNVREGCPPEIISNLVKTEKLLVGYGPGIEVTMDATSYSSAFDMYSRSTSTSGSVSIFGFCISAGASANAQRTSVTSSSNVQWNSATNSVTIKPQNDLYPVLVGVLGRRLA